MRLKEIPHSSCILILLNVVLLILLLKPRKIDPSTIPQVGTLEGRSFKAETKGGKETLPEIGHFITHLEVNDNYIWLFSDDSFPSIWDWEVDLEQGCLLSQNGSGPRLRLENHGSYLAVIGLTSKGQIYFVEDGRRALTSN